MKILQISLNTFNNKLMLKHVPLFGLYLVVLLNRNQIKLINCKTHKEHNTIPAILKTSHMLRKVVRINCLGIPHSTRG